MLQLRKSVSLESLKLPFRQALAAAAEIGAEAVEINARTMLRPQELSRTGVRQIRKWLGDYSLDIAAVSFPTRRGLHVLQDLDKRLDGLKGAMTMANELGCRIVSNQIGKIPDESETESHGTMVAALTDLAAHSLKAGAWLAIRTGPDDGLRTSALLQRLPDGAIGVDFDPAELMLYGHSPSETLKPLSAMVSHFRARDAVRDLSLGRGVEVQLGRGSIDLPALLAQLEEHQYRGFITVERRDTEGNPKLECAQAIEYLTNLFS